MRIAKDADRTHFKSFIPGGEVVITVDINLKEVQYDKVKDVNVYLFNAFKNDKKLLGAYVGADRKKYIHNQFVK